MATVPLLTLHSTVFSWLSPAGLHGPCTVAIFSTKPPLTSPPGCGPHLSPPVNGVQILATVGLSQESVAYERVNQCVLNE